MVLFRDNEGTPILYDRETGFGWERDDETGWHAVRCTEDGYRLRVAAVRAPSSLPVNFPAAPPFVGWGKHVTEYFPG